MATVIQGYILWKGDTGAIGGNSKITKLGFETETGKLGAFKNSLRAHSLCNVSDFGFTITISDEIGVPGVGADVSKIAIIYYRDPANLNVSRLVYPAPIAADIETTGLGKRIKQSVVVSIAGYLSTLRGVSIDPLYGTYYEKI